MRGFVRRHPFTLALLMVGAVFVGGIHLATREAEARRQDLCRQYNTQQTVIRQLVNVATENSDAPDVSALTTLPQFQAQPASVQAFWLIVLNGNTGQSTSSTQQRLIDFAKHKLQPADCSHA